MESGQFYNNLINLKNLYNFKKIILIIILIILLILIIFSIVRTRKSINVLVIGPNNSGKTSFVYKFVNNKFPLTVTSQKNNLIQIKINNKRINLYDVIDIKFINNCKYILLLDSTCRKSIKQFSYILFQIITYVTGSSVTVTGTQKSIYNTNITKVNSSKGINKDIGSIGASTVTEENSTTRFAAPGKGANFTAMECTMGKGANFMPMECTIGASTVTEEKILNKIAAVTNFGESSTFSEDTNTNITKGISKAPFGAGTVGTTGAVGASTVTALIICNKNDIYNSKNINEIERIIMLELELLSTESNELNKFLSNLTSLKDLERIGISINLMSYSIKNSNLQEIKEFIMK